MNTFGDIRSTLHSLDTTTINATDWIALRAELDEAASALTGSEREAALSYIDTAEYRIWGGWTLPAELPTDEFMVCDPCADRRVFVVLNTYRKRVEVIEKDAQLWSSESYPVDNLKPEVALSVVTPQLIAQVVSASHEFDVEEIMEAAFSGAGREENRVSGEQEVADLAQWDDDEVMELLEIEDMSCTARVGELLAWFDGSTLSRVVLDQDGEAIFRAAHRHAEQRGLLDAILDAV